MAARPPTMPTTGDRVVIFPLERQIQVSVVAVSIVFIIVPTIMVAMRLIARRIAHRAMDGSDWCIIAACVFSNALQAVSIVSVMQCGVGFHNAEIIPKYGFGPIIKFLKVLVAQQILWAISLSLCKIAILLLYSKIFTTRMMILAARTLAGFTMMWTVVTVLIAFFICRPLSDNWLLDLKNRNCGNQPAADGTMGVLNMITDIAVLVMPISHLWKLRLEMYKKIALIVTFSLGVFTCIVSALRLYYLANLEYYDVTFNIPNALIFSALEPGVGITLACIPFLRPLLGRSQYSPKGTANYYSSNGHSARLVRSGRESTGFVLVNENSSQYQLQEYDQKSSMPKLPGKVLYNKDGSARDSC
ncbi:satratoxin biosynthesis SC1 cluster protein 4 [Colletotrichum liriopes]|uniref:Satratoxin biosynthesis SC1 cluster protein 4 n=1 Tax=Colletotrichum liriopes TaxID=708192 RepID=A0AA37LPS8_9PEZI|nr:satratoxin biosynthesis SC1 cluster protein 4 [Colletotrichum liriopes]